MPSNVTTTSAPVASVYSQSSALSCAADSASYCAVVSVASPSDTAAPFTSAIVSDVSFDSTVNVTEYAFCVPSSAVTAKVSVLPSNVTTTSAPVASVYLHSSALSCAADSASYCAVVSVASPSDTAASFTSAIVSDVSFDSTVNITEYVFCVPSSAVTAKVNVLPSNVTTTSAPVASVYSQSSALSCAADSASYCAVVSVASPSDTAAPFTSAIVSDVSFDSTVNVTEYVFCVPSSAVTAKVNVLPSNVTTTSAPVASVYSQSSALSCAADSASYCAVVSVAAPFSIFSSQTLSTVKEVSLDKTGPSCFAHAVNNTKAVANMRIKRKIRLRTVLPYLFVNLELLFSDICIIIKMNRDFNTKNCRFYSKKGANYANNKKNH